MATVIAERTSDKSVPEGITSFDEQNRHRAEGIRLRARRLRLEAKARGETTYFTGQPCKYGHIDDRFVSNGKCRECNRLDCEQANRLGLYR